MNNPILRLGFSKTGSLKYISHLDLTRVFTRAFRRAGIEIKHTEGFNPHPRLAFGLPLSVGTESVCEIADIVTAPEETPEGVYEKLQTQLPEGLTINSCEYVMTPEGEKRLPAFSDIYSAEYRITLFGEHAENRAEMIASLMNKETIIIEKRSKSGMKSVDIRPRIYGITKAAASGEACLVMSLSAAPESYMNPEYIIHASEAENGFTLSPDELLVVRTKITFRAK